MILLTCALLTIAIFAYVFFPERHLTAQDPKSRLEYLEERKAVLYDNLRDLNFEYRAGKYPEEDYLAQRAALENEAGVVLAELDQLQSVQPRRA